MIINAEYLTEKLCEASTNAGIDIIPWHGQTIDYKQIIERLSAKESTFYSGFDMDRTNDLYEADGYFLAGIMMPFVYDLTAKGALQQMQSFIELGLDDNMNVKRKGPYDIGGLQFRFWNPIELKGQAVQDRTYFFVENRVEVQFNL